jgi:hypothetical protein
MNRKGLQLMSSNGAFRCLTAILCAALLIPGEALAWVAWQQPTSAAAPEAAAKIPNDQLDSLVAPIALYPDPMLAQVLAASTYPLEIIQLQQWMEKNKDLKDQALVDALKKQNWDPSIQALAMLPDVVKRLSDDIQWTADLGNAFLAQQSDLMDAVQRMRKKAQEKGNLKTTEQQKVETKVVEEKQVIVIEQSNPQVVYVPSYDPVYVYGPPVYPYPPIYYPPAGYYAAGMAISFGVGLAIGAAWGGWGWGCGWGHNDIDIDVNNNFNRNTNINRGGDRTNIGSGNRVNPNRSGAGSGSKWQHNPQHRGAAPYSDRSTANKFGGTTRGDSMANRQASARQSINRQGGRVSSGTMDRGAGNRAGAGAGTMNRGAGSAGGDRIGNRSASPSASSRSSSAFGGSRSSGSSARASSSRGSSSFGGGGGRSFSGGGGARGGGGGRR